MFMAVWHVNEAVVGRSNLIMVSQFTHRPFPDQRTTLLNTIKWRFQKASLRSHKWRSKPPHGKRDR